jgi:ABC-type multidrug transport system fused ATPase/permease subunit
LLSVIQYFGVPLGFISLKQAVLRSSLEDLYIGIGGFYDYLEFGDIFGISSRNQGYFSEPANFGQFLNLPLFISAYKFFNHEKKTKKTYSLIIFLTIALAYFLTFSVANFFGLFIGLMLFYFFRINNKFIRKKSAINKMINVLFLIGVIFSVVKFYEYTNSFSTKEAIIGKSTSSNLIKRAERNQVYFDRIKAYPFGDIEFKKEYTAATGLIGSIAIVGGYPLLILMFLFFLFYFRKIYSSMKKSKYLLIYIGFFSYMVPALWDAKFYEYYFLFVIVFFSTIIKHEQMGKKII